MIPYTRHDIDEADISAVCHALRSGCLTCGPILEEFEAAVAKAAGTAYAVAVSSGTAALHCALKAAGIKEEDEVIVPALTFAATANAVGYCGASPVFADVEADTLCLDARSADMLVTDRTRAIIPVEYAGQSCNYGHPCTTDYGLWDVAEEHRLSMIVDGCHALGGSYHGRPVGSWGDMTCFSFHPAKHVACGEGGAVTTNDRSLADYCRRFRNHGRDGMEMVELGYNYRLSEISAALGLSQIQNLDASIARRREIAERYRAAFGGRCLAVQPDVGHAWHLFVIRVGPRRDAVMAALRDSGIDCQVHYRPVYLHPYYGGYRGTCPVAEKLADEILSLPMFPSLSDSEVDQVIEAVHANL